MSQKNRDGKYPLQSRLVSVVIFMIVIGGKVSCIRVTDEDQNMGMKMAQDQIAFSTYFGGSKKEQLRDVEIDSTGNIYITGGTESPDFPTTAGAYDRTFNGWHDVYVVKLDPSGNIIWSTFLGGSNYDRAYAIEVDSLGYVFVAGRAGAGFPTSAGTVQPNFGGDVNQNSAYGKQDGFITKLSQDGSQVMWSTYFGDDGRRIIRDMVIDDAGNVYVGLIEGIRPNPHITQEAFQTTPQGGKDGLIAKLSSDGAQVLWATYLGGSSDDVSTIAVRVDDLGYVYTVGATKSTDIPTSEGAYDTTFNGEQDVYVAKLTPDGSNLVYGTYLGGSQKDGSAGTHGLAVDTQGNAYVAGYTFSANFPTTPGSFQTSFGGVHDLFVSKLSMDGSQLLASTFVGGSAGDGNEGIVVDGGSNVYLTGRTASRNFPLTYDAIQSTYKDGGRSWWEGDGYFVKLSPDFSKLLYSTYIGGSGGDAGRAAAVDSNGNFYLGGMDSIGQLAHTERFSEYSRRKLGCGCSQIYS